MFRDDRLPERFWSKVEVDPSGCWLWTGSLGGGNAHAGHYGRYRERAAHRAAYIALVGPVPTGLVLDHLCRVRRCVNPLHLEAVTNGENVRRGFAALRAEREARWA